MDENAKHLLASLQRDPSRVQALFHSGDGQTLLRMLTEGDQGASLQHAAQSAAQGRTEELQRIVMRSAALLGIEIDPAGAREIASRSRGTPRIANRLLRRVRDFAQVCHDGVITTEAADHALGKLEVDKLGLDAIDRRMLTAIIRSYGGGPVGLETLAATIGEEAVTLEDVYEPYLLQIGFLTRTPRGRCVTPLAYEHLHLPAPVPDAGGQLSF